MKKYLLSTLTTLTLSSSLTNPLSLEAQNRWRYLQYPPPEEQIEENTEFLPEPYRPPSVQEYTERDFSNLKGMRGFSDEALEAHFKLYGGYVKNVKKLLTQLEELLRSGETTSPHYAELKRRFGWEFNGMRLHEYYFENLGGNGKVDTDSPILDLIIRDFGSFSAWEKDFRSTGSMRGIGWVILYRDPMTGRLMNVWIGEHDIGHLSGAEPLLVMDVWEHAYMIDYGINRGDYINAFLRNINWNVVSNRAG